MTEVSDVVVGAMMAFFALIGLLEAARAVDTGMYIFGLSLFGFACIFGLGLIRRHFDRVETARALSRADGRMHGGGHV